MARLDPLPADALGALEPLLGLVEQSMGFRPNSMATMARVPGLPEAFAQLTAVIWGAQAVSGELKALVAVMASQAAGCRYCQAHTAHRAHEQFAVSPERLAALWRFEDASEFSAVVGRGNFAAAQFHPERSSTGGARLLRNFLGWQS